MSTKIIRPQWCKNCRKELIQRDMSIADFAKCMGVTRPYMTQVLNGRVNYPETARRICEYLGVEYPDATG
ncbi:MAG: helix-turn-helix transcriptional regulator [Lachnospiraceae bacterium]|nr:helix-turn-helix transcriptional regulator [Lachnospiraceae bacterium]